MPGLVKIGRTTRPPEERAIELSTATSVPTPFELVFDILVPDCVQAEAFLHEFFSERGFRLSDNREFFEAPVRDVITLMLQVREFVDKTPIEPKLDMDFIDDLVNGGEESGPDPLLRDAAEVLINAGQVSTALLQRRFEIGYARASLILDQLHDLGVIGPKGPTRPPILIAARELDTILPI
jgi:DNA segregation ATPase FtsK/SpoIIIE-like protein